MMKWKDLEGNSRGRIEGLRKPTRASIGIAGVAAKIRTENLSNMGLESYRQTNLFSSNVAQKLHNYSKIYEHAKLNVPTQNGVNCVFDSRVHRAAMLALMTEN
jgi:hypothetical protein